MKHWLWMILQIFVSSGVIKIQCNLSQPNLLGTNLWVWNRQVFGLYRLNDQKISYIGTLFKIRFIQVYLFRVLFRQVSLYYFCYFFNRQAGLNYLYLQCMDKSIGTIWRYGSSPSCKRLANLYRIVKSVCNVRQWGFPICPQTSETFSYPWFIGIFCSDLLNTVVFDIFNILATCPYEWPLTNSTMESLWPTDKSFDLLSILLSAVYLRLGYRDTNNKLRHLWISRCSLIIRSTGRLYENVEIHHQKGHTVTQYITTQLSLQYFCPCIVYHCILLIFYRM